MSTDLTGKNVLVMGLGKFGGGFDAAVYASKFAKQVIATDLSKKEKIASIEKLEKIKNIELVLGEHRECDFEQCDIAIINPAVPPENRFIKIAKQNGAIVTSAIALFFENCPAKIISITGSNGKSTTTALTHHILKFASENSNVQYGNVFLGGNIGNLPLLETIPQITENDLVVLEISSFQAEQLDMFKLAPFASAITNLTPNHLDRHITFENYCNAKKTLFANQKNDGISVFNAEDEVSAGWFEEFKNIRKDCYLFNPEDVPEKIVDAFTLPGRANLSDLAAAMVISHYFGVADATIAEALKSFKALPHRLQLVAQAKGVKWYNDSISTTPESTIAGINAFDTPMILLAGGYDKKIPFDDMAKLVSQKVPTAVLIGVTAEKIKSLIESHPDNKCDVILAGTLEEAVNICNQYAKAGDSVVLSPACASYDMFENFQQRGNMFSDYARKLCNND